MGTTSEMSLSIKTIQGRTFDKVFDSQPKDCGIDSPYVSSLPVGILQHDAPTLPHELVVFALEAC